MDDINLGIVKTGGQVNISTEFNPGYPDINYDIEGEFDYGIGAFFPEKVSFSDENGNIHNIVGVELTIFTNMHNEALTKKIMKENDIFANDGYLLNGYDYL